MGRRLLRLIGATATGLVQGWSTEIRFLARAATMAGKNLNRRTFVEAMSRIKDFPGGESVVGFGPDKFSGPSQYRVVGLHVNSPPSSACKRPLAHLPPRVVCWPVVQPWMQLPENA